jgi:hypothetical protein
MNNHCSTLFTKCAASAMHVAECQISLNLGLGAVPSSPSSATSSSSSSSPSPFFFCSYSPYSSFPFLKTHFPFPRGLLLAYLPS